MQLELSSAELAFREEVRDFLADHLTPDLRAYAARMTSVYAEKEINLAWQAILLKQGWAAPSWPVEFGGCDWTVAQHYIFDLELARAGAPPLSPMGIGMCGPAIIGYGTPSQKEHYLPRILSGEDFWCQGYSEPQAGSDLAALSMSATEDGDDLICNGQKIWTTHGDVANKCFCLVRTDNSGKRQEGITFLLIDMDTPGVRVDPIIMTSGEHIQNTLFFTDVRVPKENIVGELNQGWTVAKYLLEFERGGSSYAPRLLQRIRQLRRIAADMGNAGLEINIALSETETSCAALEAAELQFVSELSDGRSPGLKASMMKILGTELSQRITELTLDVAGTWALPFQPHHTCPGGPVLNAPPAETPLVGPGDFTTVSARYFNDRAGSIYAGSNEIQRNILAKQALGL
nr:acyl-CoA dehydrogenase family protein [uncultured Hyphomonas sp.]